MCAFNLDGTLVYCGADDAYVRAMHVHNGSLLWAFKTGGAVVSSAVVDEDGHIYVGSHDKYFYALYSNGTKKWKRKLKEIIWSSPVVHPHEDIVYIAGYRAKVLALNKQTGKIVWKYRANSGSVSSPKLNELSTVLYLCDTSSYVYALDSLDGSVILEKMVGLNESIHATPAIDKDGALYLLLLSGGLVSIDIQVTKRINWRIELGNSKYNVFF